MWTLAAGVSLLAVWLLLLTMDTLDLTHFSFLPALLEVGVLRPFWRRALVVCWIIWLYEKRI